MENIFFQPVKKYLNISEAASKALLRLKIETLRDLLFYRPVAHQHIAQEPNLEQVEAGQLIQTTVTLEDVLRPTSRKAPLKLYATNSTGAITLVFFNKIHPFLYNKLKVGQKYTICGKIEIFDRNLQISHPEFIFNKKFTNQIIPIYPLTYGITNKQLYGYVIDALKIVENTISNINNLGSSSKEYKDYLVSLLDELKKLHLIDFVGTDPRINQSYASSHLAKKELLANQLSLTALKRQQKTNAGRVFTANKQLQVQVLSRLQFELTDGQQSAISEIEQDQISSSQMVRMLQGDVGSGKTLVALLTMLNVVSSGAQASLMAPTDLLSIQHYQFFSYALENTNVKVGLLTGKMTAQQHRKIKKQLQEGEIDIIIGTHALFQKDVEFKNLGYVIIDEQHRFGVEQRLELVKKSSYPDLLVMTATPIPRSLTLTMFGDMNVSKITSKPKNRLPIITSVIPTTKKHSLVMSFEKRINLGEKIYWVCPLIDQSDKLAEDEIVNFTENNNFSPATVQSTFDELSKLFPGKVAALHGKMKSQEKDQIMQEFKEGSISVLVATTVIEVGIDVPDSNFIVIENAEKFGLAQLHQLRGRVGRGAKQSYCILIYNPQRTSQVAAERLKIMRQSNDGFYIAEEDLKLRGGGEILGLRQSGEPVFYFANLSTHLPDLLEANKMAGSMSVTDKFVEFQIKLFARDKAELIKSG